MFNKLYENIKKIFIKNKIFFLTLLVIVVLFKINLPYTIDMPGGFINVSKRIQFESAYETEGSFNMAYVSEINANVFTYVLALLNPNWDIINNKDLLLENDNLNDLITRNKLALEEANNNAKIIAFKKAGYEYEIKKSKIYVAYISKEANTDLEVGDEIISINNNKIVSKEKILEYINEKSPNDEIKITVMNNNTQKEKFAKIKNIDGKNMVGIVIYEILELETNPEIDLKNATSESGPSGGLMTSLAIYNSLVEEDITKGRKIVGTGTIDKDGNVGSIGGVKYKIIGAVRNNAKIFIVPNGENYEEAKKIVDEKNYKIDLVGVSTFDDVLEYLKK